MVVKTAGGLKLNPIIIENKRVEKTPRLLF